ncbi:MAG TPA: hypothetical protein VLE27_06635 [Thermoanaerobaculia bacterium]|nr:hypothetical protein [Thermoanaerobaculia bacterium]
MLAPLLRFHLAVGARLAMRVLVPTVAAAVGGGFLLGNDFLTTLSQVLFGPKSSGGSGVMIAAIFFGVAVEAAPRVCRGVAGWMRHLPVSGVAHRRAAGLAIAAAQTPILLGLLLLASFASRTVATLAEDVLGLALTALAMALAATPARRRWISSPLALGAAVAAGSGGWTLTILGAALLVAGDLAAGPLARSGPPVAHAARRSAGGLFEFRIAWRALGWTLLGAFLLGLLPVGGAFAFVSNNTLAPEHVRLGALLGGGLAFVFLFAQISESLAVRRPAWPWSRSLPWSASRRVVSDALFLSLHAVPLIALAVAIHPVALAALGLLPLVAARSAGAMRRAPERKTGAVGEILMEGFFLAALVALVPWTALLTLALTPWAVRAAAERERRQKVSRWLELHHLAAGDPQSWSAS